MCTEKDDVSSGSDKSLEHVLNPEFYHQSHFTIHPFPLMLDIITPLKDVHTSHLLTWHYLFFFFLKDPFVFPIYSGYLDECFRVT